MQKLLAKLKNVPRNAPLVPCSTSSGLNRVERLSDQSTVLVNNNLEVNLPIRKNSQGLRVPVINMKGKPLMPCRREDTLTAQNTECITTFEKQLETNKKFIKYYIYKNYNTQYSYGIDDIYNYVVLQLYCRKDVKPGVLSSTIVLYKWLTKIKINFDAMIYSKMRTIKTSFVKFTHVYGELPQYEEIDHDMVDYLNEGMSIEDTYIDVLDIHLLCKRLPLDLKSTFIVLIDYAGNNELAEAAKKLNISYNELMSRRLRLKRMLACWKTRGILHV